LGLNVPIPHDAVKVFEMHGPFPYAFTFSKSYTPTLPGRPMFRTLPETGVCDSYSFNMRLRVLAVIGPGVLL
jgi:hypothetical protein